MGNDAAGGIKCAVEFDSLDGSSNIELSVSIGSIFSIYKIDGAASMVKARADAAKAIQHKGTEMVVAGCAMYGSVTNLVILSRLARG